MSREDRRGQIRRYALRATGLTSRERVIMAGLTELPNEIDPHTGQAPRDCYPMTAEGKFRHRQEYVAATFGFSPQQIKIVFKNLRDKGALSTLSVGAHGRASAYQALVLRGSENNPLRNDRIAGPRGSKNVPATSSENNPLRESGNGTTRGSENNPLTYKTPDQPDHAPSPREEPPAVVPEKSAVRKEREPRSSSVAAVNPPPTGDADDLDAPFLPRRSA